MKVIDKRAEKNNDWHVGDVICLGNMPDKKYTGLIIKINVPTHIGYGLLYLDDKGDTLVNAICYSLSELKNLFISEYSYVEKVNAHLVVED